MPTVVRVLIVEDIDTDAELALRKLRADGIACTAQRVENERDFRAALSAGKCDIIISDFSLPGFDGLSALSIAASEAPHIPFIFLSGTIGEERAIEALQRGAVDYVLKSNLNRLAPAVRRALSDAAQRTAQRIAEERLRDVIDTAQDWIWELDRDGRFVFSSESVRNMLGIEAADILGQHFSGYLHDTDRSRVAEAMRGLSRDARILSPLTARWRHHSGEIRWFERHALALLDAAGTVTGFRGADRDVTERELQQARIMRLTRILQMLSGINTDEVMKHVGDFGTESSNFGGVYGKQKQNARVIYFLVDANGRVKDWATEFYQAGTAKCWVGVCGGAKNEQVPFEELDRIVKTSAGGSIESWRTSS